MEIPCQKSQPVGCTCYNMSQRTMQVAPNDTSTGGAINNTFNITMNGAVYYSIGRKRVSAASSTKITGATSFIRWP